MLESIDTFNRVIQPIGAYILTIIACGMVIDFIYEKSEPLAENKLNDTVSTLSMYYPAIAMGTYGYDGAGFLDAFGYGLANTGYLLAFASIVSNRFDSLRLRSRLGIVALALIYFVVGVVVTNIRL